MRSYVISKLTEDIERLLTTQRLKKLGTDDLRQLVNYLDRKAWEVQIELNKRYFSSKHSSS